MASYSHSSSAAQGAFFQMPAFVDAVLEHISRRRLYRRTLNELGSLSNRQLADLGLNRSMLRRVAWQAAYENSN